MARTAWKPPVNYNDIRRATDARRRELIAKMRGRSAQSAEPIAEPVSVVAGPELPSPMASGVLADDGVKEATRQVLDQEVSSEVASIESHVDPASDGGLSGMPAAISTREPMCVEAESWLGRVGLADRAGLGIIADLLKESAMLPPRTLRADSAFYSWEMVGWRCETWIGVSFPERQLRKGGRPSETQVCYARRCALHLWKGGLLPELQKRFRCLALYLVCMSSRRIRRSAGGGGGTAFSMARAST
jgi:hypothetical protein